MFDHFVALAPLFLALTAATPVLRGRLVDTDTRWSVISAAVDDRTPLERGEASANGGPAAKEPRAEAMGIGLFVGWVCFLTKNSASGDGVLRGELGWRREAVAFEDCTTVTEVRGVVGDTKLAGGGATRLAKSRYASISGYISGAESGVNVNRFNDVPRALDSWTLEVFVGASLRPLPRSAPTRSLWPSPSDPGRARGRLCPRRPPCSPLCPRPLGALSRPHRRGRACCTPGLLSISPVTLSCCFRLMI